MIFFYFLTCGHCTGFLCHVGIKWKLYGDSIESTKKLGQWTRKLREHFTMRWNVKATFLLIGRVIVPPSIHVTCLQCAVRSVHFVVTNLPDVSVQVKSHVVSMDDVGRSLTCTVSTADPVFSTKVVTELTVFGTVRLPVTCCFWVLAGWVLTELGLSCK